MKKCEKSVRNAPRSYPNQTLKRRIDDDERMILRNIIQAMKDYIETNDIHAGVHQRQERIFLRNDTVPIAFAAAYPRAIVNASKRNRLNFETEKKVYEHERSNV